MSFSHKHILGTDHLSREDIELILETAESFKEINERDIKKVPTLRGKTVINAFFENSTRTRLSFEIAGKRVIGEVVQASPQARPFDAIRSRAGIARPPPNSCSSDGTSPSTVTKITTSTPPTPDSGQANCFAGISERF